MAHDGLEDPGRRRLLGGALALAASALVPGCSDRSSRDGGVDERPDIVVVLADDLGREWLGCYGGQQGATPHIDALAAHGVLFEHCYATPRCHPSRAELMTGTYPFRLGFDRDSDRNRDLMPFRRLPEILRRSGYETAIFGKWHLGTEDTGDDFPRAFGFDEYAIWERPPHRVRDGRYRNAVLRSSRTPTPVDAGDYAPDFLNEQVVEFVRRERAAPCFLYYPTLLVHRPEHTPPGGDDSRIEGPRSRFAAMVARLDEGVGALARAVAERESARDTLLLFASDNGGTERAGGDKGALTDGGTRVPCIVHWRGCRDPGRRTDALVDFSDLLPTLCAVAGCAPEHVGRGDGQSFAAHLTEGAPAPRSWVFSDWDGESFVRERSWKHYSSGRLVATDDAGREIPIEAPAGAALEARERLARLHADVLAGRTLT